jgi:hypothetical protein
LPDVPTQAPARLTERAIDSSLLFGLLLIAGGFGLGAAAVYLLYPRKASSEGDEKTTAEEPVPALEAMAAAAPESVPDEGSAERMNAEPSPVLPPSSPAAPPGAEIPSAVPSPSPLAPPNGEPHMTDQTPPVPPAPEQRLFPVVTLLRDEVTGQLVLQVGARTYRDSRELRDSADWTRVEYAARDLTRWIEGGAPPPRRVEERRPEEKPKPGSMVEQINLILESKLAAQPASGRAVRLVEGPDGSVRVYVGVQPYNLEEVPDPAIRAAIREAVAEWEAGR